MIKYMIEWEADGPTIVAEEWNDVRYLGEDSFVSFEAARTELRARLDRMIDELEEARANLERMDPPTPPAPKRVVSSTTFRPPQRMLKPEEEFSPEEVDEWG